MTKYHSRAEINQNTAKMDADDKRAAAGRAVTDPSAARDFTATSLWVPETQAMPVATASDLGVLALSLVRHLLEPIKAKALREPEAAKDELAALFAALPVPDARDLTQTVKDLKNLTPGFRQVCTRPHANRQGSQKPDAGLSTDAANEKRAQGDETQRPLFRRLCHGVSVWVRRTLDHARGRVALAACSLLRKNERRICFERTPRHGRVVAQRHGLCGLERWLARLCL